ncbi:MAG: Verrucomicrobia phage [Pseudomonadota bacterium]|jgi:hypothetical protein
MQILARDFQIAQIDSLRPYAGNSRKHSARQIEKIAASIAEFGFNAPILIDSESTIVAGHGRFAAAQRLGLREVPVIQLGHLTEAKRKAYIIADNRIAEDASWDMTRLAAEVQALQAEDADLLGTTGLDDVDFTRIDIELRRMAADLEMIDEPVPAPAPAPVQQAAPAGTSAPQVPPPAPAFPPISAAPAPLAPLPSAPQLVPFNVLLSATARETVLRVLNDVKAKNGLPTLGDALAFVCRALDGAE